MTKFPLIFIDSDVVISSFISKTGAANLLIQTANLSRFISTLSYQEIEVVTKRLHLDDKQLSLGIRKNFTIVSLTESLSQLQKKYSRYTTDPNDAHIVAGAIKAKARFLITYNLKHFRVDSIKKDFSIITYQPATFLQYLRSREKN